MKANDLTQHQKEVVEKAIGRLASESEFANILHPFLSFSESEMSAFKIIINEIDEWNFLKRNYGKPGFFMVNQKQEVRDKETWIAENYNVFLIDMRIDVQKFMEANKIDPNPVYISQ